MSSSETTMEEADSFISSTNGIIYPTSDHSGWAGDSMISGPNITSSSTSTDDHNQQQISTNVHGGDDDDISSSGASSSWFKNSNSNKQSDHQQAIRIFNVDFRALSGVALRSANNKEDRLAPPRALLELMGKSCNNSSGGEADSTGATNSATSNSGDMYLKHLNKLSHKPITSNDHVPVLPIQHALPLPQTVQLQTYSIYKGDLRAIVQQFTGSPGISNPIQQPEAPSSRLQRLRPPPLAQLSNRPHR